MRKYSCGFNVAKDATQTESEQDMSICKAIIVVTSTLILTLLSASYTHADQDGVPLKVIYPLRIDDEKGPHDFVVEALKLVLEKSGERYDMRPSGTPMQQTRAMKKLSNKDDLTVFWAGTSPELEEEFLPVRIPIMQGLLGYRLFIIHSDKQHVFDTIHDVNGLRSLHAGQGLGWSDVDILQNAGFSVTEVPYELIFGLIQKERLDYFPRGLMEIEPELREFGPENPDLVIEKRILLVYPFAMFFFVNKDNVELAQAISKGFEIAHQDGSFARHFAEHPHIQSALRLANSGNRIQVNIPNPYMTLETRNIPRKYWYEGEISHRGANAFPASNALTD